MGFIFPESTLNANKNNEIQEDANTRKVKTTEQCGFCSPSGKWKNN